METFIVICSLILVIIHSSQSVTDNSISNNGSQKIESNDFAKNRKTISSSETLFVHSSTFNETLAKDLPTIFNNNDFAFSQVNIPSKKYNRNKIHRKRKKKKKLKRNKKKSHKKKNKLNRTSGFGRSMAEDENTENNKKDYDVDWIPSQDMVRLFGGNQDVYYEDPDTNNPKSNGVHLYKIKYLKKGEIKSPILKHFTLYEADYFYPPWSYFGFFSPTHWHKVPIEYFTRNTNEELGPEILETHQSAMHICSKKVTSDAQKCYDVMENECISDQPSPINILTSEAKEDADLTDFTFFLFDTSFEFKMFFPEDGTDLLFLQFVLPKRSGGKGKRPGISKGTVGNHDLYLDRVSFHYGKDRSHGSEHLIDGKRFGMEIQLYFTSDKSSYWEAVSKYKFMKFNDPKLGNNMHILSVMVEVTSRGASKPDNQDAVLADRFHILSSAAEMFWKSKNPSMYRGIKSEMKLISLKDFLAIPLKGSYYTYEGSLTHPPCLKHAKWTVFETPMWITYNQWLRFAEISSEFADDKFLGGNYRDVSEILIKVDIPTYIEMRKIEGLEALSQKELDMELYKMIYSQYYVMNDKKNETTSISGNSSAEPELFVVHKYEEFPKYFAKQVKKGRQVSEIETTNSDDEDYYTAIGDDLEEHSLGSTLKVYYYYFLLILMQFAIFLAM